MKKSELKKLIREVKKEILKEEYVELISVDDNYDQGLGLLLKAWKRWKDGPETEKRDIAPAAKEYINSVTKFLKATLK